MDIVYAQQPPIARFPLDILEYVFLLNILKDVNYVDPLEDEFLEDMDTEPDEVDGWRPSPLAPISIARAMSQVCRWWRSVALKSARLWGRSLETIYFPVPDSNRPESMEWWQVAVQRSGTALLWVKCTNTGIMVEDEREDQLRVEHYLLPVLESSIGRIECLQLNLSLHDGLETDPRWMALRGIGSALREVSLSVDPFPVSSLGTPALAIGTTLTSSILSIQSLALFTDMNMLQVLNSLKYLPQLRILRLIMSYSHTTARFPSYQPEDAVILKHLEVIELQNCFGDAVRLLPRIRTKAGCKLSIRASMPTDEVPPSRSEAKDFKDALHQYLQQALDYPAQHQSPSTALNIGSSPSHLYLGIAAVHEGRVCHCKTDPYLHKEDKVQTIEFIVYREGVGASLPDWIIQDVMHALVRCRAPMLTKLGLSFESGFLGALGDLFPAQFLHFLGSLTSVATLSTEGNSLLSTNNLVDQSLAISTGNACPLFPALSTLNADFHGNSEGHEASASAVSRFLTWRIATGRPLVHLLLDDWMTRVFRVDMFPGLETIRGVQRLSHGDSEESDSEVD